MGSIKLLLAIALGAILPLIAVADSSVVSSVCTKALENDKRVHYPFCVESLERQPDSERADARGLAEIAASLGVIRAGDAVLHLEALQRKLNPPVGGKLDEALMACRGLYTRAGAAFVEARTGMETRNYAAARKRLEEAIVLPDRCRTEVVEGKAPTALTWLRDDTVQWGIICKAMTNVI